MSKTRSVAMVGLPAADRTLLQALIALGSGGGHGYVVAASEALADLLIVDPAGMASPESVRTLARGRGVVLIGQDCPGSGWPVVLRPVRLPALLEAMRSQELALPPGVVADPRAAAKEAARASLFDDSDEDSALESTGFAATRPFSPSEFSQGGSSETRRPQFDPQATVPLSRSELREHLAARPSADPARPPAPVYATLDISSPHAGNALEATVPMRRDADGTPVILFPLQSSAPVSAPNPASSNLPQSIARSPPENFVPQPVVASGDSIPTESEAPETVPVQETLPEIDESVARVLLICDKKADWAPMRKALRDRGCELDLVAEHSLARKFLIERSYRAVILDRLYLGDDTFGVCSGVRQALAASSRIPGQIIILSPPAGWLDRIRARFVGCNAWLSVPLRKHELMDTLGLPARSGQEA